MTRRIAEDERLRDYLHYINERGLPFDQEEGERSAIINKQKDQSDTIIIEAAPGALKVEKDWTI